MKPLISVVILSWDKLEETRSCLESLRKITYPHFEIVVVDNGSSDGSKEFLQQQNDVELVDLPTNTGFTGGQIAGFSKSKGSFIALLNNDAIVAPDWLECLLAPMDDPKVAAVGGRAYLWDKEHAAYDDRSGFYSYQVVDMNHGYAQTLQVGDVDVSVNSISGAGVLIRRAAVDQVGYFDDRFFAYYEETDLFARFKRAGYKILYAPKAKTWHKIGASTKDKPLFYLYQMHRNRFMYGFKNFDQPYLGRFVRSYVKESLGALLRYRSGDLDTKARVRAFGWNLLNLPGTIALRRRVRKLGPNYSELLVQDACQTVSIVIPCYNYRDFVGKAIESALAQTIAPLEIIVINDGSTDDSLEQIRHYAGKVRIIDQPNSGVIKTKNIGLSEAAGDWIIFLDADDLLQPTYIEKCLRLARTQDLTVVYTDMELFGAIQDYFKSHHYSHGRLRLGNYIHNSALIQTSLIRSVGGYKEAMASGYEDWELYISLAEAGMRAGRVDESLLRYRQHDSNTSRNFVAVNKASDIYHTVYELHPKTFNHWFFIRTRIEKIKFKLNIGRTRQTLNYYVIDRFFLSRKAKGLLRLLLKGDLKKIRAKTVRHYKNIRNKAVNWDKD